MNINPNLTGAQNIIAQATDPVFTAPTNPEDVGVGVPLPYPPPSGKAINGVNVDGDNSNTMVKVYVMDTLEDVTEDGANQVILYERNSISDTVSPNVTMASGLGSLEAKNAMALSLGLVSSELLYAAPYTPNQTTYVLAPIPNSVLYLPGTLTVNVNYSD
jgi:hypothetical protein